MNKFYQVGHTLKAWLWVVLATDAWLKYQPGLKALEARQLALETFNDMGGIDNPNIWETSPYSAVKQVVDGSDTSNDIMGIDVEVDVDFGGLLQVFTK